MQPPFSVFRVHRILVSLTHKANAAKFWFGQVVHGRRKLPGLAVIELDTANVLLAAPNHLRFFFAFALGEQVWRDRHRAEQEQCGQE